MPLLQTFAEARLLAYRHVERMARGDYSPEPAAARFPAWVAPGPTSRPTTVSKPARQHAEVLTRNLTVAEHWSKYVDGTGIALGSQKRFRPILVRFCVFLGSENFADATQDDVERWIKALHGDGLSQKTINESCLAAARAFCSWGVSNKKLPSNPFSRMTFKAPRTDKKSPKRPKGLTDAEASLILSETLRVPDPRMSTKMASARRWIPWICAYTGARVNEITQARRGDFSSHEVGGQKVWAILITPEAGSVKNREPRLVPLHPHLIEQGFDDFILSQGPGPLFYEVRRPRRGSTMNPPYLKVVDRLAEWVRDIGVTDEAVAPNHGWRHRFQRINRLARGVPETRDAILGHAMRTEGEEYAEFPIEVMWPEILLLPRYEVSAPEGTIEMGSRARARSLARMATAKRAKERRLTGASPCADPVISPIIEVHDKEIIVTPNSEAKVEAPAAFDREYQEDFYEDKAPTLGMLTRRVARRKAGH